MSQALQTEPHAAVDTPTSMDTGTFFQRLFTGVRRLYARADWSEFVGSDWPDHIMAADVTDDFNAKQGRSTGRWILETDGRQLPVYLKRHYQLPLWHGILAAFWPEGDWSPGMLERHNLEWAHEQGICVPRVVAAGEFLGPWGKLQSFLAIEELTNMLPLHQAIPQAARQLDPLTFRKWKNGLVKEIARMARLLHDKNSFHKDFYLCHFFIHRDDLFNIPNWRNRVFLIDFHRLTQHSLTRAFWVSKDLGQLLFSSEVEGIDARDRLRFWHAYRGTDRRSLRSRFLRGVARYRGWRYREHNEKHPLGNS